MKMSIKGSFELGLTEVPEKMAKDFEKALGQLNSKYSTIEVKVEEDEPSER